MEQRNLRMVIIGESGAGKSETGNSVLGIPKFEVSFGDRDRTWNNEYRECQRSGMNISIIDTPGPSNARMERNEEKIAVESAISSMKVKKGQGPNVLLYCIRIGRISEETIKIMKAYKDRLGHEMMSHTIVVFTCHDLWQDYCKRTSREEVIDNFENSIPIKAQAFIKRCRGKVYFNNCLSGEEQETQVQELFKLIKDMMWRNDDHNYQVPPDLNPGNETRAYNSEVTQGNSWLSQSKSLGLIGVGGVLAVIYYRFLQK